MSSANDRQVGGTHYASEYQHWDFVVDAGLGYFEAQISKYGTRHRKKAGKQDLEKAGHFCDKLISLAMGNRHPEHYCHVTDALVRCYAQANQLDDWEHMLMRHVCSWLTVEDLQKVRGVIDQMLYRHYGVSPFDEEPGQGYVNQDRQGP